MLFFSCINSLFCTKDRYGRPAQEFKVKLSATRSKNIMGVTYNRSDVVGYLPKETSEVVLKGLKAGKRIKARIFDFVPKFEESLPTYNVSIWMN